MPGKHSTLNLKKREKSSNIQQNNFNSPITRISKQLQKRLIMAKKVKYVTAAGGIFLSVLFMYTVGILLKPKTVKSSITVTQGGKIHDP